MGKKILKEWEQAGYQHPMAVDDVSVSSAISTRSGETVQLFFNSSGTRTSDAGEAAGTAVTGQLARKNILDEGGGYIGTFNDTSLSFTSTALTTEVKMPFNAAETADFDTWANKLAAITANFANGEYCVDYRTGTIYGVKTSTTTTLTSTTYQINVAQSSTGSQYAEDAVHTSGDTGTQMLGVRNDTLAALAGTDGDYAPLQVDAAGALYVSNTTASGYAEDSVFVDGSTVTLAGTEIDDPTALAAMTEGDVGNVKGDLAGRLIITDGTQRAGENLGVNRMMVEEQHSATRCTADTLVLTGSGYLHKLTFSASGAVTAGLITVFDNTAESGTTLWSGEIQGDIDPLTIELNSPVSTGIYVGYDGTIANVEVVATYRAD